MVVNMVERDHGITIGSEWRERCDQIAWRMVEIRHVRPHDWESLKAIRLYALRDSPDAFCTTYEEAVAYDDDVWIRRASVLPQEGASVSLLAFDSAEAVGMAVGIRCDDGALNVVSMFVTPHHRGRGIARDLLGMVEVWGREQGADRAVLDVEAANERATTFYASLGYVPTGTRETYPGRVWLHRVELAKSLSEK